MGQAQQVRGAAISAGRLAELLGDMTAARPAYRHLAAADRELDFDGRTASPPGCPRNGSRSPRSR
jgi:hypothetical protein